MGKTSVLQLLDHPAYTAVLQPFGSTAGSYDAEQFHHLVERWK